VIDTDGAGDWCTAGLRSQVAAGARNGFAEVSDAEVEAARRYGQALSAWNCRFEGARGGMYDPSRRDFERDIDAFRKGSEQAKRSATESPRCEALSDICPSCPQAVKCRQPLRCVDKLLIVRRFSGRWRIA
jgi:fructokinase